MKLAVIPARGGSKRIPRKNIKDFLGKPILAYSIELAQASNLFDKIVVSTDDEEIAEIAREYGAEVPFIRPANLSGDFVGTGVVGDHAISWLKENGHMFEYMCTIYATAPLLQLQYLMKGFEELKNSKAVKSFSSTSMPFPIQRTFKITKSGRCEMFWPENYLSRSQDLDEAFQDAGQFYWTKLNQSTTEIMFGSDSIPIVMPRFLVQDIDTEEDWDRAEMLYKMIHAQ